MNEAARKLRNAYQKEWKLLHPDKVRKYNSDYWERKAAGYTVIQKARDLRQKGMTQREIAKELNISVGAVNAYLHTN